MITIIARRWFQKTYGNTYHSVTVYKDGEAIGNSKFNYGYGDSYLQTAHQILAKVGIFDWQPTTESIKVTDKNGKYLYDTPKESRNHNEAYSKFIRDMQDNRQNYIVTVTDVANKKDL